MGWFRFIVQLLFVIFLFVLCWQLYFGNKNSVDKQQTTAQKEQPFTEEPVVFEADSDSDSDISDSDDGLDIDDTEEAW